MLARLNELPVCPFSSRLVSAASLLCVRVRVRVLWQSDAEAAQCAPKLLTSLLQCPTGERAYEFLLHLTTYALLVLAKRAHRDTARLLAAMTPTRREDRPPDSDTLEDNRANRAPPQIGVPNAAHPSRDAPSASQQACNKEWQLRPGASQHLDHNQDQDREQEAASPGAWPLHVEELYYLHAPEYVKGNSALRNILRASNRILYMHIARLYQIFLAHVQSISTTIQAWQPQIEYFT